MVDLAVPAQATGEEARKGEEKRIRSGLVRRRPFVLGEKERGQSSRRKGEQGAGKKRSSRGGERQHVGVVWLSTVKSAVGSGVGSGVSVWGAVE
eukprot:2973938-Rhodomonas_salina.2